MMGNPQLENGHIRIANEIWDALVRTRLSGEQRQCLDFILRKTYGYNKKTDFISNSQFVKATGIRKQNIQRAIRALIDMNIVIKIDTPKIPSYRFNKRYTSWKLVSKKSTGIKIDSKRQKQVSKLRPTKDKLLTKDIKKKNYTKKKVFKKPSIEEIKNYCLERENKIDAEEFFSFYESKNWMIGKNKMSNWKMAIITWEKSRKKESQNGYGKYSKKSGFKEARPRGTNWKN